MPSLTLRTRLKRNQGSLFATWIKAPKRASQETTLHRPLLDGVY